MQLTRRYFLQSSGALAVYCGVAPVDRLLAAGMDDPARHPVTRNKTLVVVFLRGGIDGLNWVVPYGDGAYAGLRPQLGVAAPGGGGKSEGGVLDLDGFFGLNPRCADLMPMFDEGLAVAAHAVGYGENSRSHFEEQDVWETGVSGNTIGHDGWLNRHLLTSTGHGGVRAVAFGDTLPRILRGDAPAYAVRGLKELAMPGSRHAPAEAMAAALEQAYARGPDADGDSNALDAARDLIADAGRDTLEGVRLIEAVASRDYTPAADYPAKNPLGEKLQSAAQLIKADIGLEVVQVDFGGWDTHNAQGNGAQGGFGNKLGQLSAALAAFTKDLGPRIDDTLVLTLSDFGRTAKENGTGGTDHGWANALMAIGGPVAAAAGPDTLTGIKRRRKVVSQWPGLGPEQLHEKRDLLHTTDFRDVLGEVVRTHLGNDNLPTVLPGHAFERVGLI